MRVVLDENVLISASMFRGVSYLVLGLARQGWLHNSVTEQMLTTIHEKLILRFGLSENAAAEAVADIRGCSGVVEAAALPEPICRDTDDDHIIACASSAAAMAIVTMDKDLLVLNPLVIPLGILAGRTIPVISPADLVNMLMGN